MGKTIAVSILKGGVGKTMTAASLSAGLASAFAHVDVNPHSLRLLIGRQ